jgi:hypothetical protein
LEESFSFGHEENEAQVLVPPGVAPDEPIDLTSDDVPDVVLTSEDAPYHSAAPPLGTYFRGLRMLPGSALLMAKADDGSYQPFQLMMEQELNPTQLAMGVQSGSLRWADPAYWRAFVQVLKQRYGSLREADEPIGWLPAEEPLQGALVFHSTQYGRPMVGCFEVGYTTPGGELRVTLQGLVDEGAVLKVQ